MTKFCFLRVGNSSPASGLLVRRSRPGANIEAQPRFNPRSGRVGLFFLTRMVYLEVFREDEFFCGYFIFFLIAWESSAIRTRAGHMGR